MRVRIEDGDEAAWVVDGMLTYDTEWATRLAGQDETGTVSLANNWATTIGAWIIWLIIAFMNVATPVLLGLDVGGD
jgi:hypothetical protein